MRVELDDWKNGWHGVRLSASPQEIQGLIGLLQGLLNDRDEHFHISSDYKGDSGLGDIEISVKVDSEPDNFFLGSLALAPGDEIP